MNLQDEYLRSYIFLSTRINKKTPQIFLRDVFFPSFIYFFCHSFTFSGPLPESRSLPPGKSVSSPTGLLPPAAPG